MEKLGKCCGTCLWCYREDEIEDFINTDDELNIPQAGDCALGVNSLEDKSNCYLYDPIKVEEETLVIYDEEYMGPGYFIINNINGEMSKFIKIYTINNNGFPVYYVRAYDSDIFQGDYGFKEIIVYLNDIKLYRFNKIMFQNVNHKENNYIKLECVNEEFRIILMDEKNSSSNFVDMELGDIHSCHNYEKLIEFYDYLSKVSVNKEDLVSRVLQLK